MAFISEQIRKADEVVSTAKKLAYLNKAAYYLKTSSDLAVTTFLATETLQMYPSPNNHEFVFERPITVFFAFIVRERSRFILL